MTKLQFLIFASMIVFAHTSAAFPYVIRIKNKQGQPLLVQDNNGIVFQILPEQLSEFVVTDKNDFRIRYQLGKTGLNLGRWAHDEPMNSLTTKCSKTRLKHSEDDLLMCAFSFEGKKRSSRAGPNSYELSCDYDINTKYKSFDFLKTVQDLPENTPVFYNNSDLALSNCSVRTDAIVGASHPNDSGDLHATH